MIRPHILKKCEVFNMYANLWADIPLVVSAPSTAALSLLSSASLIDNPSFAQKANESTARTRS